MGWPTVLLPWPFRGRAAVPGPYCVHLAEVYATTASVELGEIHTPGEAAAEMFTLGATIGQIQIPGATTPADEPPDSPLPQAVGEIFVPGAARAQLQCEMDDLDLPPT